MNEVKSTVTIGKDSQNTSTVREGKAEIIFPNSNEVFYNQVQEFNRDLSCSVIKMFAEEFLKKKEENVERKAKKQCDHNNGEHKDTNEGDVELMSESRACSEEKRTGITILEALAASGLRSIRYALEIPNVKSITANDISKDAYKLIQKNVEHNKVENLVKPSQQDASLLMYKRRHPPSSRFDVIDVDPYGSASPFLDAAVQSVSDGGILLVTCTDMGVLCGNHSEACFGKYGGMSLKAKFCHEMALRLVLSSLESNANRYKRHIVPLLSMSVDFYVRVFVQVFTSASEVKRSPSKQSLVYHCPSCGSFHLQQIGRCVENGNSKKYPPATGPPCGQRCDECNSRFHLGGPLWSAPIHNQEFVNRLLSRVKEDRQLYKTSDRMIGILSMIQEELPDCPLYYSLDSLSATIHCTTPSLLQFRSAIISAGYRVSTSHACRTAIKTDAPNSVIWDVMRCWEKLHPVKRRKEGSPAASILSREPQVQASFECRPDANPSSRKQKLVRFQENPEPDWGPKPRAKRKLQNESLDEKRKRLQGKRTKPVERPKDLKQYSCKRFKEGMCENGDQCRYSHKANEFVFEDRKEGEITED